MCLLLTYLLTAVPSILTLRQILIHKSFNRFATVGLPVAEWAITKAYQTFHHHSTTEVGHLKYGSTDGILKYLWVFPKIGVPQNGWFIMENHIKDGWFGGKTHYFRKHPYGSLANQYHSGSNSPSCEFPHFSMPLSSGLPPNRGKNNLPNLEILCWTGLDSVFLPGW